MIVLATSLRPQRVALWVTSWAWLAGCAFFGDEQPKPPVAAVTPAASQAPETAKPGSPEVAPATIPAAAAETKNSATGLLGNLGAPAINPARTPGFDESGRPVLGVHSCDINRHFTVRNIQEDGRISAIVEGKFIEFKRVPSVSGAHRFESLDKRVLWIGVSGKSILLDMKRGTQLATDCYPIVRKIVDRIPKP